MLTLRWVNARDGIMVTGILMCKLILGTVGVMLLVVFVVGVLVYANYKDF